MTQNSFESKKPKTCMKKVKRQDEQKPSEDSEKEQIEKG